jgi:hypothetical protein
MVSVVIGGAGVALAFVKVNGQPLSKVAINGIKYLIKPRLYVWQRGELKKKIYDSTKPVEIKKSEIKKRLTSEELEEWTKKNIK